VDRHLERLRQEIESAVTGLSFEQLSWHAPGKWSTAEILEHLYLTYTGTLKGFARVVDGGRPILSKATWKHRAQALVVLRFNYLPRGREAPPHARPRGLPVEKVRAEVLPKITEMDEFLTECAAKFGRRLKVLDHPFLGPFSIDQWRKFHLVHGRHHAQQIRKLRSAMSQAAGFEPPA
jgi:DinB superfamily